MKVLFVSVFCLGLSVAAMAADTWLPLTRVGNFHGNNGYWDIAVAAKNGKFGLVYFTGSPNGNIMYNQLNYVAGAVPTVAVTDDRMADWTNGIDPVGVWGGQVMGLEFNASGQAVAAVGAVQPNRYPCIHADRRL